MMAEVVMITLEGPGVVVIAATAMQGPGEVMVTEIMMMMIAVTAM